LGPKLKNSWLDSLRTNLRQKIMLTLSPHQASILLALILGETSLFSPEQKNIYQNIGAQHLLAVSGL
jgi:predicted membrane metal-binding protein